MSDKKETRQTFKCCWYWHVHAELHWQLNASWLADQSKCNFLHYLYLNIVLCSENLKLITRFRVNNTWVLYEKQFPEKQEELIKLNQPHVYWQRRCYFHMHKKYNNWKSRHVWNTTPQREAEIKCHFSFTSIKNNYRYFYVCLLKSQCGWKLQRSEMYWKFSYTLFWFVKVASSFKTAIHFLSKVWIKIYWGSHFRILFNRNNKTQ